MDTNTQMQKRTLLICNNPICRQNEKPVSVAISVAGPGQQIPKWLSEEIIPAGNLLQGTLLRYEGNSRLLFLSFNGSSFA